MSPKRLERLKSWRTSRHSPGSGPRRSRPSAGRRRPSRPCGGRAGSGRPTARRRRRGAAGRRRRCGRRARGRRPRADLQPAGVDQLALVRPDRRGVVERIVRRRPAGGAARTRRPAPRGARRARREVVAAARLGLLVVESAPRPPPGSSGSGPGAARRRRRRGRRCGARSRRRWRSSPAGRRRPCPGSPVCASGCAPRQAPSFSKSGWPVSGSGRRSRISSRNSSGVRVTKAGVVVARMSVSCRRRRGA